MSDDALTTAAFTDGVTVDERNQLIAEIDRLFTRQGPIQTLSATAHAVRSRGWSLPLVVNFAAVLLLVGGILVFRNASFVLSSNGTRSASATVTTEGLVVEAVRKQAAASIRDRDARITEIQAELARLRSGSVASPNSADTVRREQQLEQELAVLAPSGRRGSGAASTAGSAETPAVGASSDGTQSAAAAHLDELQKERDRNAFVLRQVSGLYQGIGEMAAGGHASHALSNVDAVERLLASFSPATTARFGDLITSIRAADGAIRTALEAATSPTTAALTTTGTSTTRGTSTTPSGSPIASTSSQAPETSAATGASPASSDSTAARDREVERQIASLDGTIASLRASEAANTAELRALQSMLASLRSGLLRLASDTTPDSTTDTARKEIIALLNMKVQIRDALDTPAVRADYPGLADQLTDFFDRYGTYFRNQGRSAALEVVNEEVRKLESLAGTSTGMQNSAEQAAK